jgi:hypothetical protein
VREACLAALAGVETLAWLKPAEDWNQTKYHTPTFQNDGVIGDLWKRGELKL